MEQVPAEIFAEEIDRIFDELNQCHLPGAAVGIALHGLPVYRKGFGLANIELPVALSPTMRMRLGSVTKHFTALAFLLMCEDGSASLSDTVGRYCPEFHPTTHRITMHQLMTHTSGLCDACGIRFQLGGYEGGRETSADLLSLYAQIDGLEAPPGTTWSYNNGAYLVLSAVIEIVAGTPLEAVLRERIFEPIGMHDTMLRRWDTDFVPNSATPHTVTLLNAYEKRYWAVDFAGAGAIVSTVDDLLRWLAHMDAPVVGSAETWSTLKTAAVLQNGFSTGYGCGLIDGEYRGIRILHHTGGWLGGTAKIVKVPDAGLDIVVMVNRSDAFAPLLALRILDAVLPGLRSGATALSGVHRTGAFSVLRVNKIVGTGLSSTTGPENARQSMIAGTFQSPTTGRVVQLYERDGQQIVAINGYELPYEWDETGRILQPVAIWSHYKRWIRITDDASDVRSIELINFGDVDTLLRLSGTATVSADPIRGRYRCEIGDTNAVIFQDERGVHLRTEGRFGRLLFSLEALSLDTWRAHSPISMFLDGILCFDQPGGGFGFSSYVSRPLGFRRDD